MGKLAGSSKGQLPSSRTGIGRGSGRLLLALGGVLLMGAQTRALAQACFPWVDRTTAGPSPRSNHAMAYDSARGVTVLFGGWDPNYYGDTWEWGGPNSTWTLRSSSGPSPRHSHAMAYDSVRGVTVLFGGGVSGGLDGETWEWDGTSWTLKSSSGAPPRHSHAMAYDSARGVTVLFGGVGGGYEGDTWQGTESGEVGTLTLTLKDAGPSWVDIDPNDPNWAPFTYPCGTELTLTAMPVGGKAFKKWKIFGPNEPNGPLYQVVIDTNNPLYLTIGGDYKVKAIFKCGGGGIEGALPLLTAFGALGLLALTRRRR